MKKRPKTQICLKFAYGLESHLLIQLSNDIEMQVLIHIYI